MAQRTITYRSDAGGLFDTEHEALQDDLRHFIFTICKNEVIARDVASAMVAGLDKVPDLIGEDGKTVHGWQGLTSLLHGLAQTRPDQLQPSLDLKQAVPVPAGVRWSAEAMNFYNENGVGMGQQFFNKWEQRRAEFPALA